MTDAVILDAVRTPHGKGKAGGGLSHLHPAQLLSETLQALVERNRFDAARIDDVITGCVSQVAEQAMNIGRTAVLGAGFPESVPATTVDRQCGSSQQAMHFAAQGVMAGVYDLVVACGVESMSRVPIGSPAGDEDPMGPAVTRRYAPGIVAQGISAELIAARWRLDRKELDEFSVRSHELATQATRTGAFEHEKLPVAGASGEVFTSDETIRPSTSLPSLAALPLAFHDEQIAARFPEIGWKITAGNSSPLTDGASAVLIASPRMAEELGLRARARFHSFAVVGDDPILMLTGPIPATRRVLGRAGLSIHDIDAYEVNEAFAPVPLVWAREVGADIDKLNQRGGAIALGHPLGATGTRLMTTLLNILEHSGGRYGLQTICEGGGLANATIIERVP